MNKNNIVKSEAMSNTKPAEALAEAIVKMAIHDYIDSLEALAVNPANEEARWTLDDCTDFFRGEWYAQLSPIEGELMIEMIEKSVNPSILSQSATLTAPSWNEEARLRAEDEDLLSLNGGILILEVN